MGTDIPSESPRPLKTDADVDRLLQACFPPVDDPAARAAIVARFAQRAAPPTRRQRARVVWTVSALALAVATAWWRRRGPRLGKADRHGRRE